MLQDTVPVLKRHPSLLRMWPHSCPSRRTHTHSQMVHPHTPCPAHFVTHPPPAFSGPCPVSAVPSLCRALLTLPSVAKNIFLFQTHAPRSPPTGSLPTSTHLAPEVTFFSRAQAPSLSLQSPQGLADTQYMFVNCFMNKTAVSSLEECYKTHMDEVILG